MAAPSEEMQRWDAHIANTNEARDRQAKATMPELRAKKQNHTRTPVGVAPPANPPATSFNSGQSRVDPTSHAQETA
jgi:hypothetical protein